MALKLYLTGYEETLIAHLGDPTHPLTPPTPLAALTAITGDANPYFFDPFGLGATLFAAMGGPALLDHLDRDADELLLLITDDRSAALPWEYAALSPTELLIWRYRLLRLLPEAKAPRPAPAGPLNFIVLAADPLVDPNGDPLLAYSRFHPAPAADEVAPRLDLTTELNHIHETLSRSRVALTAQRIPPTERHLAQAVRRSPALLHLSCHGSIIEQTHNGLTTRQPILYLEDDHGQMAPLRGDRLANLVRGKLGLVVISACRTARSEAADTDADLARALVQTGSVPAAIGMQADFPDADSGPLAAALYDSLLLGDDLGESLRQARLALMDAPHAAGLPVAYVAPEAWPPLRLAEGWPQVAGLTSPSPLSLPSLLTPPHPLVGRERELHDLARTLSDHPVVTVVGTGGIGKTALAASLAARFGWRWPGGVIGVSLAEQPTISAKTVLLALLTRLLGEAQAQPLADQTAESLFEHLRSALPPRRPLLLIDNYETVQQALDPQAAAEDEGAAGTPPATDPAGRQQAERLNRFLAHLADAGQPMLLTSRRQPVDFRHEVIFPPGAAGRGLPGLAEQAGAELFMQSSSRAKVKDDAHLNLARAVARATEGHPLAISLLAGEYDVSQEAPPDTFLAHWDAELAAAQRKGLAPHHVTFAIAFERSYRALPPALQARLAALRHFTAPFFAEGAAHLWGLDDAEQAKGLLNDLTRRSLLAVDGTFDDDTPATYRLEPVILGHLRRAYNDDPPGLPDPGPAYAAYAAWLVDRCYLSIHSNVALAQLALAWLAELLAQAGQQPPENVPLYGRQLAWLLRHYGRLAEADPLLRQSELAARQQADEAALASVLYEQAAFAEVRGDLDGALALYDESLGLKERLGDLQGKAASLHQKAAIYRTRGDLDGALALYDESLGLKERLGDLQGKAASLHQKAAIYLTRGDLDGALALYDESLGLDERLGDLQGKAASLHQKAAIYRTRGDLDGALALYDESLGLYERLGDLQGKAASLHQKAAIYRTRGDLDGALALYDESLGLDERLGDLQGKAASLHQKAAIYRTRGDLDGALALYDESLGLYERLGDLQGKAASLHQKAAIYRTRGDLDGALALYDESLGLYERLGDLQGKAASLHQKAAIYLTRGDLDGALALYDESLGLYERLGDLQGKAASLHQKAAIYLTRGDLDGALALYDESLGLYERLGDLQGKAASLHQKAAIYRTRGDLDGALALYDESLGLYERLGDLQGKAFTLTNRGYVVQLRGDKATARQHYETALAIFARLGMPEAHQVRQMLAGLDHPAAPPEPPSELQLIVALTQAVTGAAEGRQPVEAVEQAIAQAGREPGLSAAGRDYLTALGAAAGHPAAGEALWQAGTVYLSTLSGPEAAALAQSLARLLDRHEQPALAAAAQTAAITYLRADDSDEGQQTLSVALYNQADYLAQLDRLAEAVAAMAEVVAIDERLGLADLASDRAALDAYRRQLAGEPPLAPAAAPEPEGAQLLAALQAQLAQAPPEAQAPLRQMIDYVSALSPAEQAAYAREMERQTIVAQAGAIVEAAIEARQAGQAADVLPKLEDVAARYAAGQPPGSPLADLAQFSRAVAALLQGRPPEPVAPAYVERLAEAKRRLAG